MEERQGVTNFDHFIPTLDSAPVCLILERPRCELSSATLLLLFFPSALAHRHALSQPERLQLQGRQLPDTVTYNRKLCSGAD